MKPSITRYSLWQRIACATVAMLVFSTGVWQVDTVSAATVSASINWASQSGRTAGDYAYGMNVYKAFEGASVAGHATYKSNVASMKPGIVRYHRWQQMNESRSGYAGYDPGGWVTNPASSSYAWDSNKINSILSQSFSHNPAIMMNISNWPSYMDDGTGRLKTNMYDAYAQFCAQLVQIVNINQQRNVKYWEITNEKDDVYGTDLSQIAAIFNKAAVAMKAVDPTIKVGGPAYASASTTAELDSFIGNAHQNLDFVSYHTYVSGNPSDSNSAIWNAAQGLGWNTQLVKSSITKYTTKPIETFHDEFNISWWNNGAQSDVRMTNEKGMIFDALSLIAIAKSGATGSLAWNEADGWYGKLDNSYNKRPSAYLYEIFNTDMKGPILNSSVNDASKIDVMAAKTGSWDKIAVVNRSEANQTLQLAFSNWAKTPLASTAFMAKQISASGVSYSTVTYSQLTGGQYVLPKDTVTVFVLDENTIPNPSVNLIANAGFESGQANWSGGTVANDGHARSGSFAMKVLDWQNAYQDATSGVTGNKTYNLEFYWKYAASGNGGASVNVEFYDGSNVKLGESASGTFWSGTTYAKSSRTFTTPAGTTKMKVVIKKDYQAGTFYVDDLRLY